MGSATLKETEAELIQRAQSVLSSCRWEVGECAALWTKRFARGRTDADFANLIGLSADQVYQRRRVWETFADVQANYPALKWSHYYAALTWEDAAECLQWAQEIQATVAEMKAWRRAQRGEDLSVAAEEEPYSLLLGETVAVREPGEGGTNDRQRTDAPRTTSREDENAMTSVARQSDEDAAYAPFRDGAASVPSNESGREREAPTPEQAIKRMTSALERCQAMLTADVRRAFPKLPEKVRARFLLAFKELEQRTRELA